MTVAARTIEDRLRAIEDPLEIYNLMACHPPAADTGADYYTRHVANADAALRSLAMISDAACIIDRE